MASIARTIEDGRWTRDDGQTRVFWRFFSLAQRVLYGRKAILQNKANPSRRLPDKCACVYECLFVVDFEEQSQLWSCYSERKPFCCKPLWKLIHSMVCVQTKPISGCQPGETHVEFDCNRAEQSQFLITLVSLRWLCIICLSVVVR